MSMRFWVSYNAYRYRMAIWNGSGLTFNTDPYPGKLYGSGSATMIRKMTKIYFLCKLLTWKSILGSPPSCRGWDSGPSPVPSMEMTIVHRSATGHCVHCKHSKKTKGRQKFWQANRMSVDKVEIIFRNFSHATRMTHNRIIELVPT